VLSFNNIYLFFIHF